MSLFSNIIIYGPVAIFFLTLLATISVPVYIVLEAIFTSL